MNKEESREWLDRYEATLMSPEDRKPVLLTYEWELRFPTAAGVYAVFNGDDLVYIGETGSIRSRMNDLRHTQHHTMRRSVGAGECSDVPGYEKATSHKKYAPHIEEMVIEFLCRLEVKALAVGFGRKEFEENLIDKYKPIYNQRVRRR